MEMHPLFEGKIFAVKHVCEILEIACRSQATMLPSDKFVMHVHVPPLGHRHTARLLLGAGEYKDVSHIVAWQGSKKVKCEAAEQFEPDKSSLSEDS